MHSGTGIADGRAGLKRRRAGKSGDRHRAARSLRDHVEALVFAVGAEGPEALDRQVDQTRINFLQFVIAEAEAFERAERIILRHDIDLLHQVEENLLPLVALEVQRDRPFVRI